MTSGSSARQTLRWAALLLLAAPLGAPAAAQEPTRAEAAAGEPADEEGAEEGPAEEGPAEEGPANAPPPEDGDASRGAAGSVEGGGDGAADRPAADGPDGNAEGAGDATTPNAVTDPTPTLGALPAPPAAPGSPVAAVAERVRPALAIVRCQGARWSVGFALGAPTTIVASGEAGGCRRELTVESLAGERTTARNVSRSGGVTLLVLDEPIGLTPLEPRGATPALGEPVYAVGVPGGAQAPIVTQGAVAFADERRLHSDAPHPRGSEGGPLVDDAGRVVAVLREPADGGVSPSTPIAPIAERVAGLVPTAEDVRPLAYPGFGLNLGAVWDSGDRLLGAAGLFSADFLDRFVIALELGGYANTDRGALARRVRRSLYVGTVSLGYRIRATFGGGRSATLTPQLGFSIAYDRSEVTTTTVGLADPTCELETQSCELAETETKTETEDWRYRPSAGVRLAAGAFELGYEVYLDLDEIGDTGHRLHVGFRF